MTLTKSMTRAEIDSNNAAFMAAFKRGDSAGVAAAYCEDAQILPPNLPVMTGKTAIQMFWQGAMDMGIAEAVLETVELEEQGDMAWEVGKGVLKNKEGAVLDIAKYIVIWQRRDGIWKWYRDIWNSNQAAG